MSLFYCNLCGGGSANSCPHRGDKTIRTIQAVADLRHQLEQRQVQNDVLHGQVAALTAERDAAVTQAAAWANANDLSREEVERLTAERDEARRALWDAKEATGEALAADASVAALLAGIYADLQNNEKNFETILKERNNLQLRLSIANECLEGETEELGRYKSIAEAYKAARDAAIAERDAAIAERDAAIAERDAAIAERDFAIAERDATLDRAAKGRDALYAAWEASLITLKKELAEAREEITHLKDGAWVEEREAGVREAMKATIAELKAERDALKAERDALKTTVAESRDAHNKTIQERDDLKKNERVLQNRLQSFQSPTEAYKAARDAAIAERDAAIAERDAAIAERDALKTTVAESRDAHNKTIQERDDLKTERGVLKAGHVIYDKRLAHREAIIADSHARIARQRVELARLTNARKPLQDAIQRLCIIVNRLKGEVFEESTMRLALKHDREAFVQVLEKVARELKGACSALERADDTVWFNDFETLWDHLTGLIEDIEEARAGLEGKP